MSNDFGILHFAPQFTPSCAKVIPDAAIQQGGKILDNREKIIIYFYNK
jgi:hypothetical protein